MAEPNGSLGQLNFYAVTYVDSLFKQSLSLICHSDVPVVRLSVLLSGQTDKQNMFDIFSFSDTFSVMACKAFSFLKSVSTILMDIKACKPPDLTAGVWSSYLSYLLPQGLEMGQVAWSAFLPAVRLLSDNETPTIQCGFRSSWKCS